MALQGLKLLETLLLLFVKSFNLASMIFLMSFLLGLKIVVSSLKLITALLHSLVLLDFLGKILVNGR